MNDGAGTPVPPTTLADGRRYSWKAWPADGRLPDVPQWVVDYVEAERAAKEAKLAEKAKNTVDIDPAKLADLERRRLKGLAESSLERLSKRLRLKTRPGRNQELYTCTGFLAPYVRGGFISETAVRKTFEADCKANKLIADTSRADVRRTIRNALARSTNKLPDLREIEDRPFRPTGRRRCPL